MADKLLNKLKDKFDTNISKPADRLRRDLPRKVAETYRDLAIKHQDKLLNSWDIQNIKKGLTPVQQMANRLGQLIKK